MTSSLTLARRRRGAGGARGAICALNHATNKIYGAEIKTRSFSLLRSFPPPRAPPVALVTPRGKSIGIFPSVRATACVGSKRFCFMLIAGCDVLFAKLHR